MKQHFPLVALLISSTLLGAGCQRRSVAPTQDSLSVSHQVDTQVATSSVSVNTQEVFPETQKNWFTYVTPDKEESGGSPEPIYAVDNCLHTDHLAQYGQGARDLFGLLFSEGVAQGSPAISEVVKASSYTLPELKAVQNAALAFVKETNDASLKTYAVCKYSSGSQGTVYIALGTYPTKDMRGTGTNRVDTGSNYLMRYAVVPGQVFLVLTPDARTGSISVRKSLSGVSTISPLGREDLGMCSGALIQEYQLEWSCGLGYVETKNGGKALRTRHWLFRLDESDSRKDVSFVTEEALDPSKSQENVFFYRYPGFERDLERYEWDGTKWRVDEVPVPKPATSTITTTIGQAATALHVSITPKEVVSDSRCPQKVACIWAGTVEVKVVVATEVSHGENVYKLGEATAFGAYTITLIEVTPAPVDTGKIPASSYKFTFKVDQKKS